MAQEPFGARVRAAALAAGLETPAQLAKACKVSRRTAEKWLRQKEARMSAAHIVALAIALRVRVVWLFAGEGPSGWRLHARQGDFERSVTILEALTKKQLAAWFAFGEKLARG